MRTGERKSRIACKFSKVRDLYEDARYRINYGKLKDPFTEEDKRQLNRQIDQMINTLEEARILILEQEGRP